MRPSPASLGFVHSRSSGPVMRHENLRARLQRLAQRHHGRGRDDLLDQKTIKSIAKERGVGSLRRGRSPRSTSYVSWTENRSSGGGLQADARTRTGDSFMRVKCSSARAPATMAAGCRPNWRTGTENPANQHFSRRSRQPLSVVRRIEGSNPSRPPFLCSCHW
jgi:hypothetical protein